MELDKFLDYNLNFNHFQKFDLGIRFKKFEFQLNLKLISDHPFPIQPYLYEQSKLINFRHENFQILLSF